MADALVLLDHSLPTYSGYAFRSHGLLSAVCTAGADVDVVTSPKAVEVVPHEQGLVRYQRTGGHLSRSLQGLPVIGQLATVLGLWWGARKLLRLRKHRLIHAHSSVLNGLAALLLRFEFKVPVVYEMRSLWEDAGVSTGTVADGGLKFRLSRALETFVLRRANHVCVICHGLEREVVARGVAPEQVTIVPNGVSPEDLVVANADLLPEVDATSVSAEAGPRIGYIGSLFEWEGLQLMLRAMPQILGEMPDAKLVVAGVGPHADALRQLSDELGLADAVNFLGRVPHEQVNALYASFRCVVYPRKRCRLNDTVTPLKPLEAMAQGTLVVASDVAGLAELVRHGETGLLFKADDVQALAETILIAVGAGQDHLCAQALDWVRSERTWTVCAARYDDAYRRFGVSFGNPEHMEWKAA